jgi:hypothetical protein
VLVLAAACAPSPDPSVVWTAWGNGGVRVEATPGSTLTCASDDERWTETAPPTGEIRWSGLRADTTYACTLDGRPFALPIPAAPVAGPVTSGATDGWLLVNHVRESRDPRLLLVDETGAVRWWHDLPGDPNVGIEAAWLPQSPWGPVVLAGGGDTLPPQVFDRAGEVRWTAPPRGVAGGEWHHDVAWVPERSWMVALSAEITRGGDPPSAWHGFAVEALDPVAGGRSFWWTSQEAVDAGELPVASPGTDPYHANALSWVPDDPEGPAIWLSLKQQDEIVRLDPSGALTWSIGLGGDFDLVGAVGQPAPVDDWFWGQHAPEPHPTSDPWIWTIDVHDNGMDRPGGAAYSRVSTYTVDLAERTASLTWTWTEPGWYEPVFGDVDRLENGNLLVTMGHCPQCGDAPADRGTSIVELDPEIDAVVWRADWTSLDSSYRAQRVDRCSWAPASCVSADP